MGLELYYAAFLDLTSCRTGGYETEGPIPWLAIKQWARMQELSNEQEGDLLYYIPVMDEAYLRHKARKLKTATKT